MQVCILGAPMDLGADRRGVDSGAEHFTDLLHHTLSIPVPQTGRSGCYRINRGVTAGGGSYGTVTRCKVRVH